MSVTRLPSTSKEYVKVPVEGAVDPAWPVEMAFTTDEADPEESEWKAAAWDGNDARLIVGPGTATVLTEGTWWVWLRITANPEIPVRQAGALVVS